MLKRRLIPKLQLKTKLFGNTPRLILVTTREFNNTIEVGDSISQAKIYQAQLADELILLDLDAKDGLRKEFVEIIRKTAQQIFMPITVGGGIKTIEDIRTLLANGADKICLNTSAIENPILIKEASEIYGSQCVVVSIDYRHENDNNNYVWTQGGKVKTNLTLDAWASQAEQLGAGELLLTSIDRDGTCKGLDIGTLSKIIDSVSIPVIISGGCGLATHFIEGFQVANASAIAAGTYFCFKDQNPMQTRAHIKNANIEIRLQN
jgi:cyclase